MQVFISTLIDGLNQGSVYALIALGYSMVYGIAKMLNFAHGDVIMVGAYALFVSITQLELPIPVTFLLCVIISATLGFVVEKLAYKPLRKATPIAVLITAIGVSYLLQNIALLVFGSRRKMFTPFLKLGSLKVGGISIPMISFVIIGTMLVIMIGLQLFIKKTKTGIAMLAVSEDKAAAQLMGININRTISITFIIGSALAGIAAILYSAKYMTVDPYTGSLFGIKAFAAAVFGGIGSIPGAMIGGILIGVFEAMTTGYLPGNLTQASDGFAFAILIIMLILKPTGIFGTKRIEKV
ncbi:MAG: branched-chain amino acid ABC transporter permease [Clostridiales bacterium]|nr:branched-chain amino acid ABC transporter permease [Clostridiales bacterium]